MLVIVGYTVTRVFFCLFVLLGDEVRKGRGGDLHFYELDFRSTIGFCAAAHRDTIIRAVPLCLRELVVVLLKRSRD